MFKFDNKNTRTMLMTSFWVFYSLSTHLIPFSSVSIVYFEQVNVRWEMHFINDENVAPNGSNFAFES